MRSAEKVHAASRTGSTAQTRKRRRLHSIITDAGEQLLAILRALPGQALDMEDATHRLTLQLIMQWSYNVDYKGFAAFGADAEKIGNGTRDVSGALQHYTHEE